MNQINAKETENEIEVCYWGSVVGVAIRCGIDGPGSYPGCSEIFGPRGPSSLL